MVSMFCCFFWFVFLFFVSFSLAHALYLFPNRLVVVFDIVANAVDFVDRFCHADGQQ